VNSPAAPSIRKEVDTKLIKLAKALAGGHLPSIAKAAFSVPELRELLLDKFITLLNDECSALCRKSNDPPSVGELVERAPTMLRLLTFLVNRSDHRNKHKRGDKHNRGICVAKRHFFL